eukprot:s724_g3.t1
MDRPDEDPRLRRLVRQLADSAWQKRAEAVEQLVADGKALMATCCETWPRLLGSSSSIELWYRFLVGLIHPRSVRPKTGAQENHTFSALA